MTKSKADLAKHKFDTSDYVELADGLQRVFWQPIESAPKDGTEILLFLAWEGWGEIRIGCWREGFECWTTEWEKEDETPTHWMPLPKPPTNEIEGEKS